MHINKVEENLYIGGHPAVAHDVLAAHGITHVLSVAYGYESVDMGGRVHKVAGIDDIDSEDLLSLLPECVSFIEEGMKAGIVLVHCQAGVSRSASVVCAYLMKKYNMPVEAALDKIKEARPSIKPNGGFHEQLELWGRMHCAIDPLHPAYRLHRLKQLADRRIENGFLNINDLTNDPEKDLDKKVYRCKKCRRQLFIQRNTIEHESGKGQESFKWHKREDPIKAQQQLSKCTSYFIEPLKWMGPVVVGVLDGKLSCPKCDSRVGSFNWSGAQCSCGAWVTPAFEVHCKRVDEVIKG
eukprot:comp86682_c0_seq1/m.48487 comp86682_c0_seq1/g.48487  ORF comp86682_c0_seq1/g.48487 comp86682_c0_seq1/m.48487 type:complete len:296 (-) comp86682_c0_seq1:217-1104(-)